MRFRLSENQIIVQFNLCYKRKFLQGIMNEQHQIPQPEQFTSKFCYTLINGQYKIGLNLNRGGYAHVYYAQDMNKNKYAIKVSVTSAKNRKIQQKYRQNIQKCLQRQEQLMMICQSQYVMKCYGALKDEKNKVKFIILQLCDFSSLEDIIYYRGHLTQRQARCIFKQLLCGLSQIHRRGLIHRDIKSSNICFKGNKCVLCDFGCSKQFLTGDQLVDWRTSIKKQGTILGTIINKSPEMLNKQPYGLKTDMWALGILLYEMIIGIPPFCLNSQLSDTKVLQYIKQNIKNIYKQQYIKKNLNSFLMQGKGNYKLSKKAENFLRKLIVIDQNERASWKNFQNEQFLLQQNKQISWQQLECSFPLKGVNWKQFCTKQLIYSCQNQPNKKLQSNKYKCQIITQPMRKLKLQQGLQLVKSIEQIKIKQYETLRQIDMINFQIRRIILLMKVRGYLGQLQSKCPKIKSNRVGVMLSMFCIYKYKQLYQKITQNLNSLNYLSDFHIRELTQILQPMYKEDRKEFFAENWGIMSSQKKIFYQLIQADNIEVIYRFIQQQVEKLLQQIKKNAQKTQKLKYKQFFRNPKIILESSYNPDKNKGYLRQWKSLKDIIDYETK